MSIYFKRGEVKENGLSFWNLHHFFTGFVVALICFWFIFNIQMSMFWLWVNLIVGLFGCWLMIDDLIQHFRQNIQKRKYGHYDLYSFWNWIPEKYFKGKEFKDV